MRIAVTGASGFVGRELVRQLLEAGRLGTRRIEGLLLLDRDALPVPAAGVEALSADLREPGVAARLAEFAPDVLFHLASLPGGAAEADYLTGRGVNLDATLGLFEALALAPREAGRPAPRVVFASSIAVYASGGAEAVSSRTPLRPALTYGTHKLVAELLLADFTRRGWLDGVSLRLPGIVARPRGPSGLASAFMSDLLHALAAGERYTCPVSPHATAWWMSAPCCAGNLVHAACMGVDGADPARAWPLPVLRLSIEEVVQTLGDVCGADRRNLVRYEPQERLEAVFGRFPPLDDREARSLGLRDDGTPALMVRRALGLPTS